MAGMTPKEQCELWVQGKSVHDDETDECCPDFSCCHPELLVDLETRQIFYAAYLRRDYVTYHTMLMNFLGNMLAAASDSGNLVHLAGTWEGAQA